MIKDLPYWGAILVVLIIGCSQMKYSERELSDDERLFRSRCRSCHILPEPGEMNDSGWAEFLPSHTEGKKLNESELSAILRFLQQNN